MIKKVYLEYLMLYGMVISIEKVSDEKLEKISGGGIEWFGIGMGIATIVVFISGIIEGYTNPGRCNWWRLLMI